ncbi:uncharacterized protein LOC127807952 [Diospyros lotus]|uniref:uncharacterized protein LOC127807952 n=1 Tax=Diospyros lotus TaxID=55363 RepID=UPI00225B1D72|nr:uncharacterized protein LOC127807952 [Diospyros lotus]
MKNEEQARTTTTASPAAGAAWKRELSDGSGGGFVLGKVRYKFWALSAILLLAFWSMFTGSVTLKWSAGKLGPLSDDDFDSPIHRDLDILELQEREKLVKHMWNVYTHSTTIRLPSFWLEAFEAAYEDLTNDVPAVRDTAISEIAKMSFRSFHFEPPPVQSTNAKKRRNMDTQIEKDKKMATTLGTN